MHADIPLPSFRDQQILAAQEPLASAHHSHVITRVVIPTLFGVRMCFSCPDCNVDANNPDLKEKLYRFGCSTCRGVNNKLIGGYQGVATAVGC
eukprot:10902667-Karenia_brevis.AAC.1